MDLIEEHYPSLYSNLVVNPQLLIAIFMGTPLIPLNQNESMEEHILDDFEKLSASEKENVLVLEKLGFSREVTLETYLSCQKNLSKSEELLKKKKI